MKSLNALQLIVDTFVVVVALIYRRTLAENKGIHTPWNVTKCNPEHVMTRIYNGRDSSTNLHPFVVYVIKKDRNSTTFYKGCGGSILDVNHILTAAHCIYADQDAVPQNRLFIWAGAANNVSNVDVFNPPTGQYIFVANAFIHPNYNSKTFENDIAIYRLARPLVLSPVLGTICIPRGDFDNTINVNLVGWGKHECKHSGVYKEATGYTLDIRECIVAYRQANIQVTSSQICARLKGQNEQLAEQAKGDSGGPLFIIRNQMYQQLGIVSFDNKLMTGCPQEAYPGVYTRTSNYISWISNYGPYFVCP